MPYGSGLSAQLGLKTESVVGTAVTPDTFYEFTDENIVFTPSWLEGQGLKAGQAYKRVARTIQSRYTVAGDFTVEHADRGHMGLLWKHALGAAITAPTLVATTAYKQILTPGPRTGLSFTLQVGRPETSGTVRAFTWRGCKMPSWEFSCSDNQMAHLKLNVDGWQEDTAAALATAAYSGTAVPFNFSQAALFKLGGTATTAAGETTIASGVSVSTLVKGITLTNSVPMRVDGYGLGNAGVKKEQIENGTPTITGSLDAEFTSRVELYDLFKANTTTALQLDFSYGDAGSGNPFLLSFILPACKLKQASPSVNGPDIVSQKVDFEAYDDGGGSNPPIQVKLVSTDATL